MVEKTIQWFRNNWFLWIILIAVYIAIRAFGYDLKIINSSTHGILNIPTETKNNSDNGQNDVKAPQPIEVGSGN
jgi:hypothetical protein